MVFLITSLALSCFAIRFKWKARKKADPQKIEELKAYKDSLIKRHKENNILAQVEFERLLQKFSVWEQISPRDFERALAFALKKDGYNLHATQYTGDGGVDLEGTNSIGEKLIVQAKKYSKNVGVSVVREMIGVRQARGDKPNVMIISLVGFTRGAINLAKKEGIALKSIKHDILKL